MSLLATNNGGRPLRAGTAVGAQIVRPHERLGERAQARVKAVSETVKKRARRRHPGAQIDGSRLIRPRDVFVTTLLNPKAVLFGLGIVPLHDPHAAAYMIAFCLMVACVGASWIGLGGAIRSGLLLKARTRLVPRIGAAVITAFAGYLVLAPIM